tara:strand:+ start:4048 stop:4470 length:423 start_codon:yes stop_codon:yes gene_type:complete
MYVGAGHFRYFVQSEVIEVDSLLQNSLSKSEKITFFVVSMSKNNAQRKERALVLMLMGMLCVLVIFFGGLVLKTHREYQNFKARENRIEAKLIQARKEFAQKEAYMARLINDPEFLERVVRERLGYARPDELLFRFADEP